MWPPGGSRHLEQDLDLPVVTRQEFPQGAEKKRNTVSCLRIPRGLLLLFCNKPSNGDGRSQGIIKAVQNPAPPPWSRKLVGEATYQTRAQHLNEERVLQDPFTATCC